MAIASIEHTKQEVYCVFELQDAWSWFVCTPADVIARVTTELSCGQLVIF